MVIAVVDLIEAEGRSLRKSTARVGLALGLIALAVTFAAIGVLICLWVGYEFLASLISQEAAALIIGLCAIAIAGLCLWAVKKQIS